MFSSHLKNGNSDYRKLLRRITFHHKLTSIIAANLKYISSKNNNEQQYIILKTIADYCNIRRKPEWKKDKSIIKDILYARYYYAIETKEYYLFGLNHSKDIKKKDYVGWHELNGYYNELNRIGKPDIFNNKEKTYETFGQYYKRECILISSDERQVPFKSFFTKHGTGVLKPVNDYGGHGIIFVSAFDEASVTQLWEKYKNDCPFMLEEIIVQAPYMSRIYPGSVNTVRYNTFYHEGKLTRLQAVFRMGRGGSKVDNATSGGIYALIDTETGRILGPARSDLTETFFRHPDTGVQFDDLYLPSWDELNSLVEELVRIVPGQKQIGFDFAYTDQGWVMVEGNTKPALQSYDFDHGMRNLLQETFGQVIRIWR